MDGGNSTESSPNLAMRNTWVLLNKEASVEKFVLERVPNFDYRLPRTVAVSALLEY